MLFSLCSSPTLSVSVSVSVSVPSHDHTITPVCALVVHNTLSLTTHPLSHTPDLIQRAERPLFLLWYLHPGSDHSLLVVLRRGEHTGRGEHGTGALSAGGLGQGQGATGWECASECVLLCWDVGGERGEETGQWDERVREIEERVGEI